MNSTAEREIVPKTKGRTNNIHDIYYLNCQQTGSVGERKDYMRKLNVEYKAA